MTEKQSGGNTTKAFPPPFCVRSLPHAETEAFAGRAV